MASILVASGVCVLKLEKSSQPFDPHRWGRLRASAESRRLTYQSCVYGSARIVYKLPIRQAKAKGMFSFCYIVIALLGYLLGSIPAGYLAGRIAGIDIRKSGSGNI